MSRLAAKFELLWKANKGPQLDKEHRFHPVRKFRFDYCNNIAKTAVELDGGAFIPGGGRHGRGLGMVNDCEKYRLASYLGWTVLRFTTKCLTAANVADAVDFFNKRIRQAVRDEGYAV